jgi:hypothetical protein
MNAYDTDIVAWSAHQAELLRRRAAGDLVNEAEIDWPNVAEEIDQLGKSQTRELASRIAAVMLHLMKLQASPAAGPRAGWLETISEQRDAIALLLADAPSLRARIPDIIAAGIGRARMRAQQAIAAHGELPRIDLETVAYGAEQVLGDWFPG